MNRSKMALLATIPAAAWMMSVPAADVGATSRAASSHGPFRVRSYIGKCLTYGQIAIDPDPDDPPPVILSAAGAGPDAAPVYLDDCGGGSGFPDVVDTTFQRIVVEEVNGRHEVVLRAGDQYIGVTGGLLVNRAPLELQDFTGGPGQIFALDGDSIILAADRQLVVEVKNARGASGTPLVLGNRDLDDSEFWDFISVDGAYRAPTDGFLRVPEDADFPAALMQAHWGSVIQIGPNETIDLTQFDTLTIPSGVTIRGDRRGVLAGPLLSSKGDDDGGVEFETLGDFVRVTGLQLEGPSRSQSERPYHTGIFVRDTLGSTIIDRNRLADFTASPVNVAGASDAPDWACSPSGEPTPAERVQVVRNFIHHNVRNGGGYGVSVGGDGFAGIVGNMFLMNRHAIAADGSARSGYRAWYNLVLSNVPSSGTTARKQADFDMHGSDGSSHHTGGIGGGEVEIARNTFLGSGRLNYDLRGRPCGLHRFVSNVSEQHHEFALRWYVPRTGADFPLPLLAAVCEAELTTKDERVVHRFFCGYQTGPPSDLPGWLEVQDNQFDSGNPTDRLGVGDFDGDGRDDLFLATGQAWYFAPAGVAEWRLLSAKTERISPLRFGDFDRDGRTDVLTKHGSGIVVSWGGLSEWEQINESGHPVDDYAIGDFDGDRLADVFYANGSEWFVSYGGVSAFVPYAVSSYRTGQLRFGDFDADRKTDVFGVVSGQWSVVPAGTNKWTPLRTSLENNVSRLVIADFDGDGRADVASSQRVGVGQIWAWRMSSSGIGDWTNVHVDVVPIYRAPGVGRFDHVPGADALIWGRSKSLALFIVSSATGEAVRWSRQEMR